MFPTGHTHFGYVDAIAGRNIRHVRGGVEVEPHSRTSVRVDLHSFWLSSGADGLYGPSLQLILPSRTTAGG